MNELSKSLRCLFLRNDVQIWLEAERCEKIQSVLLSLKQHMFIKLDERTINTADVVGIFTPQDMETHTRHRNGQWRCHGHVWHDKGQKCNCLTAEEAQRRAEFESEFYDRHGFLPPR